MLQFAATPPPPPRRKHEHTLLTGSRSGSEPFSCSGPVAVPTTQSRHNAQARLFVCELPVCCIWSHTRNGPCARTLAQRMG